MISNVNLRIACRRVLLFCLLTGVCLSFGCGKKTVATVNNEFEANLMISVLNSNGFQVGKKNPQGDVKTWEIFVDEGFFGENEDMMAIQLLLEYGLPRPPEPETKTNGSFGITSGSEENERKTRELERKIERHLYILPGVIRVSAVVAEPKNDILTLDKDKIPATATVTIIVKENQSNLSVDDVKQQVAGAVPNLKPEKVVVKLMPQSLGESPRDKLNEQRSKNKVFTIGIGVIALLLLALSAVLLIAKRRRKTVGESSENLVESEAEEDLEDAEPPLLIDEEDK